MTDRYRFLYDELENLCKARRAKAEIDRFVIAEIGTCRGDRAEMLIAIAQRYAKRVTYLGWDLFEQLTPEDNEREFNVKKPLSMGAVRRRLGRTGATIHLVRGDTRFTLRRSLKWIDMRWDFLWLDGGHSVETIESDWSAMKDWAHPWSIAIFDDYYEDRYDIGCRAVVERIERPWMWVLLPGTWIFPKTGPLRMVRVFRESEE